MFVKAVSKRLRHTAEHRDIRASHVRKEGCVPDSIWSSAVGRFREEEKIWAAHGERGATGAAHTNGRTCKAA